METQLLSEYREIALLDSISNQLQWDMETMMPEQSVSLRGEQLSFLAKLKVRKLSDSKFSNDALSCTSQSPQILRLKKKVAKAAAVSESFISALTKAAIHTQDKWKDAKKSNQFSMVLPELTELIKFQQEYADKLRSAPALKSFLGEPTRYEALLDDYEPGFKASTLRSLLKTLGDETKNILPHIIERQNQRQKKTESREKLGLSLPLPDQEKLIKKIIAQVGFNFNKGRLDSSIHPFCSGSPGDVRITTRYSEDDFTNALFSTIHENGHAQYEQNIPEKLRLTPCGEAASMGVHESQSRFFENQLGRSMPFCKFLEGLTGQSATHLYSHLNHVKPDLIRVDADEVTYNLHILIRTEIEEQLIEGNLKPSDIPQVWNENYKKYLGITVPTDAQGCMQDIHWYGGGVWLLPYLFSGKSNSC